MVQYALQPVMPDETEAVAAFIAQVIETSVDASAEEKQAFVANTRKNLALWREAPSRSLHLQCREDGRLAGVLLVRDFWNLCHLFVAPRLQGRGLGRALALAAIDQCASRSPRGGLVLNASRNARAFYEHLGFKPVADASHGAMRFEWRY